MPGGTIARPPSPGSEPIPGLDEHDAGHYTTVAGLVLARLGHIPTSQGEIVAIDGHTAEVVEITGRAITRLRLRSPAVDPEPSQRIATGS